MSQSLTTSDYFFAFVADIGFHFEANIGLVDEVPSITLTVSDYRILIALAFSHNISIPTLEHLSSSIGIF